MAKITDFLKAIIKRRADKLRTEYEETGMAIISAPERGIDDGGGYGDIAEDKRSDFQKNAPDLVGWEPIDVD